ncbi:hypothetical protein HED60_20085 [Planctomycetales bacterium ZRK34]|nr:hypothetical protein HED60_20085 [Planctomycetales bacterium ZRK34]
MGSEKQRAVLRSFLVHLDRDTRYTLMLHYVDQLTPREISMVLDRSYAWVMDTLTRLEDEVRQLIPHSAPATVAPAPAPAPAREPAAAWFNDRHRLLSFD